MAEQDDKTEAAIKAMEAEILKQDGATPDEGDDAADGVSVDTQDATSQDEPSEDDGEQPAKPDSRVKGKVDPEKRIQELEERLRASEEESRHAKAMRREAQMRNEESGRDRRASEEALRQAQLALDRQNQIADTLAEFADKSPDMAVQMLATLKRHQRAEHGDDASYPGASGSFRNPAQSREIDELKAKVEELEKKRNQDQFVLNTRTLEDLAWEVAGKHPLLSTERVKKLGVPDRVVQNAVMAVYEEDRQAPAGEKLNPYDRKALRVAIGNAVARELKYVEATRAAFLGDWRDKKRADREKLPNLGKGQGASVRTGTPSTTTPPSGLSEKQRLEWRIKQFEKASQPPMKSEVV